MQGFTGKVHFILCHTMIGKHYTDFTIRIQGKSLIVMGRIVNVIGEPHNLFWENL